MIFILELHIPTQDYSQIGTALESIGRELAPGKPKVGEGSPLFSFEGQVGFWKVKES